MWANVDGTVSRHAVTNMELPQSRAEKMRLLYKMSRSNTTASSEAPKEVCQNNDRARTKTAGELRFC